MFEDRGLLGIRKQLRPPLNRDFTASRASVVSGLRRPSIVSMLFSALREAVGPRKRAQPTHS